jgi:hypothetical protein
MADGGETLRRFLKESPMSFRHIEIVKPEPGMPLGSTFLVPKQIGDELIVKGIAKASTEHINPHAVGMGDQIAPDAAKVTKIMQPASKPPAQPPASYHTKGKHNRRR